MMDKVVIVLSSLFLIGLIVLLGTGYTVWTETSAMLDRAQVSSEMTAMAENLQAVQGAMEKRGMTHGHSALIFKSPANNMGLDYKAVKSLHERAVLMAGTDPTSAEYNVALDDMRGTIRELEIEAVSWWLIRNPFYWGMWVLLVVLIILLSSFMQ